jgi:predicted  nucleic acid-binding Zn-ribbon protein
MNLELYQVISSIRLVHKLEQELEDQHELDKLEQEHDELDDLEDELEEQIDELEEEHSELEDK